MLSSVQISSVVKMVVIMEIFGVNNMVTIINTW